LIDRREEGMDIRGNLPHVNFSFTSTSSSAINFRIVEIERELITLARQGRARSVVFRYQTHHIPGEMVSLVVYADIVSVVPRTLVRSVNFHPNGGAFVPLSKARILERPLVSPNAVSAFEIIDITPLVERTITDRLRQHPERTNAAVRTPIDQQAFYLTDNELVLLFDDFQLSTVPGDMTIIRLERRNIIWHEMSIPPRPRSVDAPNHYNVSRVPINEVLDELGYLIRWVNDLHLQIWQDNGGLVISMVMGANSYTVHAGSFPLTRSLEASPTRDASGTVYVPITFFDLFSHTTYSIDELGTILFLAYRESDGVH
jgi:hypothetical protein